MSSDNTNQSSSDFEQTLSQLIHQARLGESASQNELFRELRGYLLIIAKDHLDVKLQGKFGPSDIVQQSMIRAVAKIGEYRGDSEAEFRGWLRQIVINEARLACRSYATNKRDLHREQEIVGENSTLGPQDPLDQELTPATQTLANEQADRIKQLIECLPAEYQTVIRLRNWEELSFEEIGKQMGMSTSGAAKVWYRALVEVQRLYQDETA